MYKNNIYAAMGGDIGVCLDKYDAKHGLARNELARAQYRHWRATVTGVPELLRPVDKQLLGL